MDIVLFLRRLGNFRNKIGRQIEIKTVAVVFLALVDTPEDK